MDILKGLTEMVIEGATYATDIIQNKTELEKKLDEALYAPHGTSTTILKEIATATQHRQDFEVIMANIWRAIGSNTRNWRPIYKGLVLLEACVKFGSERCVDDARDHAFRVRGLQDLSIVQEGKDSAVGIREVAKRLTELLADTNKLREERKKSRELANKLVGISGSHEGGIPSMPFDLSTGSGSGSGRGGDTGGSEWDRDRGRDFRTAGDSGSIRNIDQIRSGIAPAKRSAGGTGGGSLEDSDSAGFDDFGPPAASTASGARAQPQGQGRRGRMPAGGAGGLAASMSEGRADDGEDGFNEFNAFGGTSAGAGKGSGGTVSTTAAMALGGARARRASSGVDAVQGGSGTTAASFDDFSSFGAPPAPAPAHAPAHAHSGQGTKPVPGLPKVGVAMKPAFSAPAPAPAPAADFDLFGAPAPAPVAAPGVQHSGAAPHTRTQPAAATDFDLFGAPAAAAPAPAAAAAFDPFAAPAPAAMQGGQGQFNPFGTPAKLPQQQSNPFAAGSGAQGGAAADPFGSFATAATHHPAPAPAAVSAGKGGGGGLGADVDLHRLVGGLHLGPGGAPAPAVASGPTLRSIAGPRPGPGAVAPMGGMGGMGMGGMGMGAPMGYGPGVSAPMGGMGGMGMGMSMGGQVAGAHNPFAAGGLGGGSMGGVGGMGMQQGGMGMAGRPQPQQQQHQQQKSTDPFGGLF